MSRVLILGGGFGGVATAHALRTTEGDKPEVILVDRRDAFAVGFRKTWGLLDPARYAEGLRPLASLEGAGIHFRRGNVDAILPQERAAVVDGERVEADALVVALGAEHDLDAMPGLRQHALNAYASEALQDISRSLHGLKAGKLGIGIFGEPYACPPAPYEIAYLLQDWFHGQGGEVSIEVFTPKPMSLPILGEAGCAVIEDRLAERGIAFLPNRRALGVEPGKVRFSTEVRTYDLLLAVPPHRCPRVVEESGLTQDGWVRPDPGSLETDFEGVFAIGDLTWIPMANEKPLPKAGVFAEAQGRAAAEHILAGFAGRQPQTAFDGTGGCFLEIGRGQAVMVEGHFLAEPAPKVSITDPSEAYLQAKHDFERERLLAWFGA